MKGGDKMKRFVSVIIAALMLFSIGIVSFAEEESIVSFDQITGKLTVSDSNIKNVAEGDIVTMIILKPDYDFKDLESGDITLAESAYAVKQTEITKAYNKLGYTFGSWSLPSSTEIGTYSIRVGINGTYVKEGSFYFITLDILKQEIRDINNASASSMEAELKDKAELFGFDLTAYDELNSKSFVNAKMADEDFAIADNATADELDEVVQKIKNKLKEYVAVSVIDQAKTSDEAMEAIKTYSDIYNVDISEDSEFGKLSSVYQKRILERICEEDFESVDEIAEKLDLHAVLVKFESGSYGDVANIISKNNDILGFDLTEYEKLSKTEKTYVHKKMVEDSPVFMTAEEAEEEFKLAVSEAKGESGNEGETDKPSSNKGSGAKGGGSQTIALPKETKEPEKEDNKEEVKEEYFNDISSVSWAEESINALYEKGIIRGKADGVFAPNDNVTRAEFIKMLTEAIIEVDESAEASFVDVSSDAWYYKYVATCKAAGLVMGYEDGTLKPESNISRQEMAVMVKRFLNYKGITLNLGNADSFSDGDLIADYAKDAAGELFASGVMNGDENKNFMPNGFTTRAQAAKVIFEALKLCK